MAGVEERRAVGHRRVGGEDAPDDVALQRRRRGAEERRHPGEGVEVVVDQHLAGDADHLAEGLDAVGLLRLADGAALELAGLVDLLELRRLAELQPVHQLEVGDGGAPGDRRIGPRRGVVGGAQRLVGDAGEDRREVRGRVQRPGGDLVAAEAADPHPLRLEPAARHLDQRQAAPLAGRLAEREAAGVVAMQQRRLDRGPPGLAGVEPAGADMRPGLLLARRAPRPRRSARRGRHRRRCRGRRGRRRPRRRRRACAPRPGSWRCGAAPRPGRARPRPAPRPGSTRRHRATARQRGLRRRRDARGSAALRRRPGPPRAASARRAPWPRARPQRRPPAAWSRSRLRGSWWTPRGWAPGRGAGDGRDGWRARRLRVGCPAARKPAAASAPIGTAESSSGCQSTARQTGGWPSVSVIS